MHLYVNFTSNETCVTVGIVHLSSVLCNHFSYSHMSLSLALTCAMD